MTSLLQTTETAIATVGMLPAGWDMPVRLLIDLACVLVLVRVIYYRAYRRADLFLTFISFNLVIFLITYLMNHVGMTLGAGFGLFAIFSMLRFRTEGISVNDMTYLFLSVALGLLMAVSQGGWVELALIAVILLAGTALLEASWFAKHERGKLVLYDNLPLVAAGSTEDLMVDLRTRTGLKVHRVDIREFDLLKDVVTLKVFYYE